MLGQSLTNLHAGTPEAPRLRGGEGTLVEATRKPEPTHRSSGAPSLSSLSFCKRPGPGALWKACSGRGRGRAHWEPGTLPPYHDRVGCFLLRRVDTRTRPRPEDSGRWRGAPARDDAGRGRRGKQVGTWEGLLGLLGLVCLLGLHAQHGALRGLSWSPQDRESKT